jgi:hypothetical protein
MPRPPDVQLDSRATGATALRTVGFVLAIALGIVSIWLIVIDDSAKMKTVGALVGFWGLLLGAFSIFGRYLQHPAGTAAMSASELAVRGPSALERPEDATARREFERQLMSMLRHEVQATMTSELARMRDEIIALRHELVEKFHGDLRMERIETTRVFGSDIEALQQEINQLKAARGAMEASRWYTEPVRTEPARTVAARAEAAPPGSAPVVEAQVVEAGMAAETVPAEVEAGIAARTVDERPIPAARPLQDWPTAEIPAQPAEQPVGADFGTPSVHGTRVTPAAAPQPESEPRSDPEPVPVIEPTRQPDSVQTEAAHPVPAPPVHAPPPDDFADLPRITPFTAFPLDSAPLPVPPVGEARQEPAAVARGGRRRAADANGGHDPLGGRRRREGESASNDLLAQILARESRD